MSVFHLHRVRGGEKRRLGSPEQPSPGVESELALNWGESQFLLLMSYPVDGVLDPLEWTRTAQSLKHASASLYKINK